MTSLPKIMGKVESYTNLNKFDPDSQKIWNLERW